MLSFFFIQLHYCEMSDQKRFRYSFANTERHFDLKSNRRSGYNVTFLYLINRKVESDKISKPTSNLYFWILNLKGEDSMQS